MAEAVRRSERLQKKREAAGHSRQYSDKSESDQEEISFKSKRAQPSGLKLREVIKEHFLKMMKFCQFLGDCQ